MTIANTLRDQTRALYTGVLGGTQKASPHTDRDYFRFPNGTRVTVFYVEPAEAPEPDQLYKAVWLEFGVEAVPQTIAALATHGTPEVTAPDDGAHRYFRAPGGQIFRLREVGALGVGIGPAHELIVPRTLRDRTRSVYAGVLGATLEPRPQRADADFFVFKNGTQLGVRYSAEAARPEQLKGGAWLEVKVDHVEAALAALDRLDIQPFAYEVDPRHKFVQSPGGQVLRILDAAEKAP